MKPLVSIVVMTYRNQALLPPALRSIFEQDYDNLEVLIFDDGSPNFDQAQVERLCKDAGPNIRNTVIYTQEQNVGTVQNYRSAIERAKGVYIFPLSCDDCFSRADIISCLVDFFEKTGCNICTAQRRGAISGRIEPELRAGALLADPQMALESTLISNYVSGSTLYMRRDYYFANGGYDTDFRLLEDYPFVLRTLMSGERIWFLDQVTIVYGEDGVSSSSVQKKNTAVGNMLAEDYQTLWKKYVDPAVERVHSRRCRRYLELKRALRHTQSGRQKLTVYLRYLDVALAQLLHRVKGSGSIYWTLCAK